MLATWKGKTVAKAWPTTRGKPKSQNQQAWVNRFSQMACISSLADGRARDYAEGIAKGTLWFWRDIVTKAMLGQFIRTPGEIRVTTPTANLTHLATVNVLTGTDTLLAPTAELWDTNNFWTPASPTNYITCRSGGLYLVGINMQWQANSAGQRSVRLQLNGATYEQVTQIGQATTTQFQNLITIISPHAGDQLQVQVRQNSGATLTAILNHFFIVGITPETILP